MGSRRNAVEATVLRRVLEEIQTVSASFFVHDEVKLAHNISCPGTANGVKFEKALVSAVGTEPTYMGYAITFTSVGVDDEEKLIVWVHDAESPDTETTRIATMKGVEYLLSYPGAYQISVKIGRGEGGAVTMNLAH